EVTRAVRPVLRAEQAQRVGPEVEHPLRLVLLRRDVPDNVLVQPPTRDGTGGGGVRLAERISPERVDGLGLFDPSRAQTLGLKFGCGGHGVVLPSLRGSGTTGA